MDAFCWSTQPPATAAPSCPTDDALLAAFLGAGSFEELHSAGAGGGTVSPDAYHGGLDLPSCQSDLSLLRCQDGGVPLPGHGDSSSNAFLDSVGFVPAFAAANDGLHLHDRFAFVPEEPAQAAAGSNAAFSGYSTTTGGGNISSGDSNTYGGGGHETEVASPPCAVSGRAQQISQEAPPPKKRNKLPDSYPAAAEVGPTATTTVESSRRWGSTNRAAAPTTTSITFGQSGGRRGYEPDTEAIAQVKEMIYRAAAMRPVSSLTEPPDASPEPSSKPRRRKNVRISSDPQTVAARLRRERVSERLRALQRLVPGGSKMDTASMLDEAASYLKFLKSQLAALEALGGGGGGGVSPDDDGRYSSLQRYTGRGFNLSSRASAGAGGGTMLAFGRDGVAGYVKSGRNMNMQL